MGSTGVAPARWAGRMLPGQPAGRRYLFAHCRFAESAKDVGCHKQPYYVNDKKGPIPEGTGPVVCRGALRGGLDVADSNHAGRLVEGTVDRHLLAAEMFGFSLVVQSISGGVSFEDILLIHLDHCA